MPSAIRRKRMTSEMGTADIVIGILAAVGIVVLIVAFIAVFRKVMLK
jgi:hypothetical protein